MNKYAEGYLNILPIFAISYLPNEGPKLAHTQSDNDKRGQMPTLQLPNEANA